MLIYFGPGDTAGLQYVGPEIDAMAAVASAHEAGMFDGKSWMCLEENASLPGAISRLHSKYSVAFPDPWAEFPISLPCSDGMSSSHQLAEVYCYLCSHFILKTTCGFYSLPSFWIQKGLGDTWGHVGHVGHVPGFLKISNFNPQTTRIFQLNSSTLEARSLKKFEAVLEQHKQQLSEDTGMVTHVARTTFKNDSKI